MESLTRKEIKRIGDCYFLDYHNYCDFKPLLEKYGRCIGCNCGKYGWNWNAYIMPSGVVINAGYNNHVGFKIRKLSEFLEISGIEKENDENE